jgi:hypothetical protein
VEVLKVAPLGEEKTSPISADDLAVLDLPVVRQRGKCLPAGQILAIEQRLE